MDEVSANYKSKCDEVLLSRNRSEAGVVFDKPMSDEQIMAILQELKNGS